VSCCFDVLKKLRARLQHLKAEREEAKQREELALRGKDVVRCHAFATGYGRSLPKIPAGTQIDLRHRRVA